MPLNEHENSFIKKYSFYCNLQETWQTQTENKRNNKNIISTCSYNAPPLSCTYTKSDGILNKRTEFTSIVSGDIIGLTEVNTKNAMLGIQSAELSLGNYQCIYSPKGRGTCLYIREGLGALQSIDPGNKDIDGVWCSISLGGTGKLVIGCVYRSPSNTDEQDDEFNNWLLAASNMKASHIVIMGDFNHPELDWIEVKSTKPDQNS